MTEGKHDWWAEFYGLPLVNGPRPKWIKIGGLEIMTDAQLVADALREYADTSNASWMHSLANIIERRIAERGQESGGRINADGKARGEGGDSRVTPEHPSQAMPDGSHPSPSTLDEHPTVTHDQAIEAMAQAAWEQHAEGTPWGPYFATRVATAAYDALKALLKGGPLP